MKFENVKAGDKLIRCYGGYGNFSYEYVLVDRVTKTMIIVGNERYNKKHGDRVGDSGRWASTDHLYFITDQMVERVELSRQKELKRSYVSALNKINWGAFELEELKHIYSVAKEYKNDD